MLRVVLLICLLLGLAPITRADVLIRDVTVIDPIAGRTPHQDVFIAGDRIASVSAHDADRTFEEGTDVLDGAGRYLIPGLWDAHVHLTFFPEITPEIFARASLRWGITSLRDTGIPLERMEEARAVEAASPAPNLYLAGPLIDGTPRVYDGANRFRPAIGIETDGGYIPVDHYCRTSVSHIYAAGDVSGKLPLSSVAQMQGRKIAEHAMGVADDRSHRLMDYDKAASAVFTEPEIADVGLAEADAFAEGRKIRVTKVPFTASPKAVINDDPRGFIKIVSDPATGVVLGGSIVGRHAAELISIVALAVTAGLTVHDIQESLFVHPTLAEALADAAE